MGSIFNDITKAVAYVVVGFLAILLGAVALGVLATFAAPIFAAFLIVAGYVALKRWQPDKPMMTKLGSIGFYAVVAVCGGLVALFALAVALHSLA